MLHEPAIYVGHVSHTRLKPTLHRLRYRVFCLWLDLDRMDDTAGSLRLFGYNERAVFAFNDRDHTDGPTSMADEVRAQLANHPDLATTSIATLMCLCYPRTLGYVFNPLTEIFAYDDRGKLQAIIHQVSNTFGQRRNYIIPIDRPSEGRVFQRCAKELYVSPFLPVEGQYAFHIDPPSDQAVIGITYRDSQGPALKALFRGERQELTDANLARMLLRTPHLTAKVTAAIHWEAAKLWMKRIALVRRPSAPRFATTNVLSSVDKHVSEFPVKAVRHG